MECKDLGERCQFSTRRLFVRSWLDQVQALGENGFARKVIEILTPGVTKALPGGWQDITEIDSARKWARERDGESHFLAIQHSSTREVIGFVFLYDSDSKPHNLRFGYLLSEKVWGKGFGTELVAGLVDWCKMEGSIISISGGVETDNIGSIKVLKKNGFSLSTMDQSTEDVVFYEYRFNGK